MLKKILKGGAIFLIIFLIGGLAGVVFERVLIPKLASYDKLAKFSFFRKTNERVTVINKTEQITVKEDFSVSKTAQGITPAVVKIIDLAGQRDKERGKLIVGNKRVRTGLIVTGDGLIVTTLADDEGRESVKIKKKEDSKSEQKYKVVLADGRELEAKFLTWDNYTNLAFYKIKASNLPTVEFGNSDELEAGEKIIVAGGSKDGSESTFVYGLIRDKSSSFTFSNSELASSEKSIGAIFIDAQITEREIGGPAIDFNGTVVGIVNEAIKDDKKHRFILPINQLRSTIDKVVQSDDLSIQRARLGVYYLPINRELALLNDLEVDKGALVYSFTGQQGLAVIKNSAAELAGVKIGDIVTRVNDEEIDLKNNLSFLVSKYSPGDGIKMGVVRDGEEIELETVLK